jgi:VWFA-related protein
MFLCRPFFALLLSLLIISTLHSQTTDTANSPHATFQSKVHVVLLDVVVTDHNDQPVAGLQKEDFEVLEEGKPQAIASFGEHKGVPPNRAAIAPLPPNFYTNYPLSKPTDSVNVLVLDALNTPLGDQATVRQQMVSYLKKIQPGPRLAIFTLLSRMRMVEGFTADPSVLLAALNNKKLGGGPQSSPLLRTDTEDNADAQLINAMASSQAPLESIRAMKEFLGQSKNFQTYSRVEVTLQALQQLARYLGGFPGRKNVIWFSGSFPVSILPTQGQNYDFSFSDEIKQELRKTTNMLAAAQVAIYPIAAEGLDTDSYVTSSRQYVPDMSGVPGSGQSASTAPPPSPGSADTQDQNSQLQQEHTQRYTNQATMDEIAKDTGGEAFYNTNGLKEALDQVINNGTHYYTISYTPTDKRMNGGYRPIELKLLRGHYRLAYRRGYFADEERKDRPQPIADPLQPLMGRGAPDATQILYEIRVLRSDPQPSPQAAIAGDNAKVKGPVTRYAVDFAVSVKDLDLAMTPDGIHHGNVEVALVAYDQDGNTLNWVVRSTDMSLKPQLYKAFEQGGVQLHQEIDVPKGDVYLRTGIYDPGTGKAGTLEIPLRNVAPSPVGTKSMGP